MAQATAARPKAKAKPKPTTKKATAARRRPAPQAGGDRLRSTIGDAANLSEDVLKSVEDGQRAAIEAVQRFVETVDRSLPPGGEGPSRREEIVDSALDMADRLVHTQYDFLRKVVHSAGKSVTASSRGR